MNKHYLILAMLIVVLSPLFAARWKTFTNTTHVNDYVETSNRLYVATWGGLAVFNHESLMPGSDGYELDHIYTNIDGLSNNDIRVIDYIPETDHLWMGLYGGGVNILTPGGIKVVNENSGLPSNKISGIVHSDSLFFVATDAGLAVFYQLANVSFPLLRQVYTNANTQSGMVDDSLSCMALSAANYLYLGTSHGLNYVHIDSLNYYSAWHTMDTYNSNIPSNKIVQISIRNDKIAVSTNNGLGLLDIGVLPHLWTIYNTTNGLASKSVYAVHFSETGDLYFSYGFWDESIMTLKNSTNITLSKWSDGVITSISEGTSGLVNKAITRIRNYNDKLFLSSWGDGIFFNENSTWYNLKTNCIGFNTISCITRSKDKMWFGSGVLSAIKTRKGTRGMSSFDGTNWDTYTVKNSPLISDNILTIAVDDEDRIWSGSYYIGTNDYGWRNGMTIFNQMNDSWDWIDMTGRSHYDEALGAYSHVSNSPQLLSNNVPFIYHDTANRMFICCYNGGVLVLDSLYQRVTSFQIPNSGRQAVILVAESESEYFFGTGNDRGISYWTDKNQLPSTTYNQEWESYPPSPLDNTWVYGVVSFLNDFGENETWTATSSGVFAFNGTNWFKYDVDIKRRIYRNGSWVTDVNGLYYSDEDRLFGSVHTNPTSIYLDPFRRIWIGSVDNGFSMYDPSTERFTNYNMSNSPLISNWVVSLGYDPVEGALYIGTPDGLNTFQIGIDQPPVVTLQNVRVFPNPFKPDLGQTITIENTSASGTFPPGENVCRIYDLSGDLVAELKRNLLYSFTWNGKNSDGDKCSSGIYFYVVTTEDGKTAKGKIALIRG